MTTKSLLLGLALSAPLLAADPSKILLIGTSTSIEDGRASGAARAIVGEMNINADVITFDREKNSLKCEGAVTIRVSGHVVTARDCAIELGGGEKKLFLMSREGIQLAPNSITYSPASSLDLVGSRADREKLILEFNSRLDSQPNKAREFTAPPTNPLLAPDPRRP